VQSIGLTKRRIQKFRVYRNSVHCSDCLSKSAGDFLTFYFIYDFKFYNFLLWQITKLKIDSNPFAKGFRDSTRLGDFEPDLMRSMFFDPLLNFYPRMMVPFGIYPPDMPPIDLTKSMADLSFKKCKYVTLSSYIVYFRSSSFPAIPLHQLPAKCESICATKSTWFGSKRIGVE